MSAFDPARFAEHARAAGLRLGEPLVYASSTGSTNDDALRAARRGQASGSVFVADHQSHGRGRSGSAWRSGAGENLLFSLLLRPSAGAFPGAALTLTAGLAVRAALAELSGQTLGVKWPNDVLAGSKKLAGILCEGQLAANGAFEALVIGVGVNVETRAFPPELEAIATSLWLTHGDARPELPPREALLVRVLGELERYLERYFSSGFAALEREFAEHDVLSGRRVSVAGPRPLVGVARGVDDQGQLLVEHENGLERVTSGTVRPE